MSYANGTTSLRGRRNGKTTSTILGLAVLVDTLSTLEASTRARKGAVAKVSNTDFINTVLDLYRIKIY